MSEILDKAREDVEDNEYDLLFVIKDLYKLERMEQQFEVGLKPIKRNVVKEGIMNKVFGVKQLYRCPVCSNCLLEKYANERQLNNHCWDCGTKIDWSDEE